MAAALAIFAVLLWFIFKILNIYNSKYQKPRIFCKDDDFHTYLIKRVPSLQTPYIPTRFWGFDGHAQTILHSALGRMKSPWPRGERSEILLEDGSTLTYDVYQRLSKERGDFTIIIVPGICNSSESVYVRTFVYYAQCHGYRCAVLNHLGALASVKLTAPRIFTYGHTDDLRAVVKHVQQRYPITKIVLLGYSLGGNLITKYLGEEGENVSKNIAGGVSVCQGYNILEGTKWLLHWSNFRRIYLYFITEAVKALILRHRKVLLSEQTKQKYQLNESDIVSAATLPELDEAYTRKVHNFSSVAEFYQWSSSANYLSRIQVPQLFLNSLDDPLVPETLLNSIRDHAKSTMKTAYIEVDYGGHLAFYEGGFLFPNTITWLDRTLLNAIGSLEELDKTQLIHGMSLIICQDFITHADLSVNSFPENLNILNLSERSKITFSYGRALDEVAFPTKQGVSKLQYNYFAFCCK